VLTNSFLLIGMETLTSGRRGFVNFTRNLLLRACNIQTGSSFAIRKSLFGIEL